MESETSKPKTIVAAFDFDGTLTYCDTLMPFLLYTFGPVTFFYKLLLLLPTFFSFLIKRKSRQETKEAVLTLFFLGSAIEQVHNNGIDFAKSRFLRMLLRPSVMKCLKWHKQQKHRCILISASLDVYLLPWSKQVGFDDLLSSSLEMDKERKVTGKLQGDNCRGMVKVRKLESLLGPRQQYELYAYGDSDGDKELLAYADHAYYGTTPCIKDTT